MSIITTITSITIPNMRNVLLCGTIVFFTMTTRPLQAQYAPGMDGRAMDANNQVGSGGLNSPVQQRLFNTGNLYITGNVTGGRAFQGFTPIRNSSSLFTSLPSTRLSSFQRDTVGLNNVLRRSNAVYGQTNPFFYSTNTVTSLGGIVAGRNLPGSSMPRTSATLPLGNPLGNAGNLSSATPRNLGYGYKPQGLVVPSSSLYNRENLDILRNATLSERLRLKTETAALQYRTPTSPYRNQSTTSSWNRPSLDGYNPMAATTRTLNRLPIAPFVRQPRTDTGNATRLRSEDMLARSQHVLSPTAIAPKLFNAPLSERPRDTLTGRPLPKAGTYQASRGGMPYDSRFAQGDTVRTTSSALNATPYGQTTRYGGQWSESSHLADLQSAYAFLTENAALAEGQPQATGPTSLRQRYEQAAAILRDMSETDVRSFATAAAGNPRATDLIIQAETELRKKRYYQAASLYRLAASADPDEPLLRLGSAHALLAAGEYLTAMFELTSAIDAYPAFGFLRIDLNAFIPDVNILDMRRADLERRLDQTEDYRLRFLLGYLEYYSGLKKFGLPNLQKAAQEAPEGSTVANFPEILNAKNRLKLTPPSHTKDTTEPRP